MMRSNSLIAVHKVCIFFYINITYNAKYHAYDATLLLQDCPNDPVY